MIRPQFTEKEEALISLIRKHDRTSFDVLLRWLPWLLMPAIVFTYGFLNKNDACIFAGFAVIFCLLCYVIYYQMKPSWQLKPIIDKYETSFTTSSNKST